MKNIQRIEQHMNATEMFVRNAYNFKNDNYDSEMPCGKIGSGSGG